MCFYYVQRSVTLLLLLLLPSIPQAHLKVGNFRFHKNFVKEKAPATSCLALYTELQATDMLQVQGVPETIPNYWIRKMSQSRFINTYGFIWSYSDCSQKTRTFFFFNKEMVQSVSEPWFIDIGEPGKRNIVLPVTKFQIVSMQNQPTFLLATVVRLSWGYYDKLNWLENINIQTFQRGSSFPVIMMGLVIERLPLHAFKKLQRIPNSKYLGANGLNTGTSLRRESCIITFGFDSIGKVEQYHFSEFSRFVNYLTFGLTLSADLQTPDEWATGGRETPGLEAIQQHIASFDPTSDSETSHSHEYGQKRSADVASMELQGARKRRRSLTETEPSRSRGRNPYRGQHQQSVSSRPSHHHSSHSFNDPEMRPTQVEHNYRHDAHPSQSQVHYRYRSPHRAASPGPGAISAYSAAASSSPTQYDHWLSLEERQWSSTPRTEASTSTAAHFGDYYRQSSSPAGYPRQLIAPPSGSSPPSLSVSSVEHAPSGRENPEYSNWQPDFGSTILPIVTAEGHLLANRTQLASENIGYPSDQRYASPQEAIYPHATSVRRMHSNTPTHTQTQSRAFQHADTSDLFSLIEELENERADSPDEYSNDQNVEKFFF